jgi:hypothetical protein|tara:strand:+ start:35 stop:271 length:237 start_codon:yes stop_codon:yes gene_type:complete
MDKFKIKILPNSKVLFDICLNIVGMTVVIGIIMLISSCSEDTFIGGYNKDLEEIHYQIFEIDSLIMTIQMELDSLNDY